AFTDVDHGQLHALAGTDQDVHAGALQLRPLAGHGKERLREHQPHAGPVGLLHGLDARRITIHQKDAYAEGVGHGVGSGCWVECCLWSTPSSTSIRAMRYSNSNR